jgi:hypothetical protein
MKRLRQWLIRLTTTITRSHDGTRLREDIDEYVAFETEANLRRGLPPDEARRRALVAVGSVGTFEERHLDQQGVPLLEHLLQDVHTALRSLRKTPGFTIAAIATLAVGLGLTSAVMSVAYALFLRPLPVDHFQWTMRRGSCSSIKPGSTVPSRAASRFRIPTTFTIAIIRARSPSLRRTIRRRR